MLQKLNIKAHTYLKSILLRSICIYIYIYIIRMNYRLLRVRCLQVVGCNNSKGLPLLRIYLKIRYCNSSKFHEVLQRPKVCISLDTEAEC